MRSDVRLAAVLLPLSLTACDKLFSPPGDDTFPSIDAGINDAGNYPPVDAGTGSDGGNSSSTDAGSVIDPAPDKTTPGQFTSGTNYPTVNIQTFAVDAGVSTVYEISGQVTGAVGNGTFYSHGSGELTGTIPTDVGGSFNIKVPLFCGKQLVKLLWSNTTGNIVVVLEVTRTSCQQAGIQVTISWDAAGDDWELHLIKEGGKINNNATDCTWTSCIGVSPDWGVLGDSSDDPRKDVDDVDAFGPENIYLGAPSAGVYTVMVEHWGPGNPSEGQVIFNVAGKVTSLPIHNFVSRHVRLAGTITWPSGTVSLSGADFDCSGNWSSGCVASIPPLP